MFAELHQFQETLVPQPFSPLLQLQHVIHVEVLLRCWVHLRLGLGLLGV